MLNVLDEKWKDHLYDLDQLRNAIHYRSWGQKDPLIEYKQEAYTMFVDLMNDIYNTFTERFLKVQLVFEQPRAGRAAAAAAGSVRRSATTRSGFSRTFRPTSRRSSNGDGDAQGAVDVGPAETPAAAPRRSSRRDGAQGSDDRRCGHARARSATVSRRRPVDWSTVGRNDPCPCGSGKKFKKCHGAQM